MLGQQISTAAARTSPRRSPRGGASRSRIPPAGSRGCSRLRCAVRARRGDALGAAPHRSAPRSRTRAGRARAEPRSRARRGIGRPARDSRGRAVERGADRDARARRPGRLSRERSGRTSRSERARDPRDAAGAQRALRSAGARGAHTRFSISGGPRPMRSTTGRRCPEGTHPVRRAPAGRRAGPLRSSRPEPAPRFARQGATLRRREDIWRSGAPRERSGEKERRIAAPRNPSLLPEYPGEGGLFQAPAVPHTRSPQRDEGSTDGLEPAATGTGTEGASYVLELSRDRRSGGRARGGKGAQLGELSRIEDIVVPPGFCVTTHAFRRSSPVRPAIRARIEGLSRLEPKDRDGIRALSAEVRRLLGGAALPADVTAAVSRALGGPGAERRYAVRSSATDEDEASSSLAGLHDSHLGVPGPAAVVAHVRRCWASLFTERAVAHRLSNGIDQRAVQMAVVVQELVPARAAGTSVHGGPGHVEPSRCRDRGDVRSRRAARVGARRA